MLLEDAIKLRVISKRVGCFPFATLLEPCLMVFRLLAHLVEFFQSVAGIAHDGDVGQLIFVQFGSIDIDVDDFRMWGKLAELPVTRSSKRTPMANTRSAL